MGMAWPWATVFQYIAYTIPAIGLDHQRIADINSEGLTMWPSRNRFTSDE